MAENEETTSTELLESRNPELKTCVDRVDYARKLRKQWEEDFKVEMAENYFLGKQRPNGDNGIVLNHFLAILKATQPNLFYRNPRFLVRAKPGRKEPANERRRAFAEGVLTAIAQQDHHLEKSIRLALQQAFFRVGVIKCVYNPKMIDNPKAGEEGEPPLIVDDDVYRWVWINARNMLFPDQGPDQDCWTWVAEEVVTTLEEAKEDYRFDKTLRGKLKSNEDHRFKRKDEGGSSITALGDSGEELFRYVEYYDILNGKQKIFAEGQPFDDFLVNDSLPAGIEDHPYAILLGWTPIEAPEPLPWPMPHALPLIDPQREYNIRREQVMNGANRSARKFYFTEGTFADEDQAMNALQSSKDMEGVKLASMQNVPQAAEAPDLNPAIYRDIPYLIQDMRTIGATPGARLADPEKGTATEANIVNNATNLQSVDMQAAVNVWLSTAGKKMLQMVGQTMTMDMWVKIKGLDDEEIKRFVEFVYGLPPEVLLTNPGLKQTLIERFGSEEPFKVTREQLLFEAEVDVVPGSARPRNLESEKRDWIEFLTIFGQFPQLALSRELLQETASKYEFLNERLVDELQAVAKQMIEINARQAGRGEGGEGDKDSTAQQMEAMTGMLKTAAEQ